MAPRTAQFAGMRRMGRFRFLRLFLPRRMAVEAGRAVLPLLPGCVSLAVAVELGLLMAVHALHPFLVMDVRRPPIFAGILGINSPSVTEGAGLPFIPFYEPMSFQQPGADAADHRPFHMTVAAGGMAAPAGLFEDLLVKEFTFRRRKSFHHTVFLPR